MYICSSFKFIENNTDVKEYKKLIKTSCEKSFRRISKFNAMAIYGSTMALKDKSYDKNLTIYTASEYGCVESMINVLKQVTNDEILMPFDFLNINGNNVGFLISEALESIGNNFFITSEDLSFEKALESAIFDLQTNETNEILIGAVDEALDYINNHNNYISNIEEKHTKDGSVWFHLSKDKTNAISEIKELKYFSTLDELNNYLEKTSYENLALNSYAKKFQNELNINKDKIIKDENEFYFGTYSSAIIESLVYKDGKSLYVGCDKNKKFYTLILEKKEN